MCSIYLIRTSLSAYYDYRISNTDAYLKRLTKERDATIDRLKEATKYNSTQQLLEKYGTPPKAKGPGPSPSRQKSQDPQKPAQSQGPRTGMPPPPTANIQHPESKQPSIPQRPASASSPQGPSPQRALPPPNAPSAEFAPNAFTPAELTKQYTASTATTFTQTHWYDRILDALLGEDETQPKNRLALICSECRLVNGQAPPGTRSLDDVGRWRCGGCSAWNGKEMVRQDDVAKLVKGWEQERKTKAKELGASTDGAVDSDNLYAGDDESRFEEMEDLSGEDIAEESVDEIPRASKSMRSKSKGKGKK
jgi:hypothetical protein